jgi:hypothetical protein
VNERIKEVALKIRREFFLEGACHMTEREAVEFAKRLVTELTKDQKPVAWRCSEPKEGYARFSPSEMDEWNIPVFDSPLLQDAEEITRLRAELDKSQQDAEQMRQDFCAAINHAISIGMEADVFLRCWNEGDWKGCAEFGFEPSAELKGEASE